MIDSLRRVELAGELWTFVVGSVNAVVVVAADAARNAADMIFIFSYSVLNVFAKLLVQSLSVGNSSLLLSALT